VPALAKEASRTLLFVEIESLDDVKKALGDWPRLFEERATFYGTREIGVRDPAGNAVILAQRLS